MPGKGVSALRSLPSALTENSWKFSSPPISCGYTIRSPFQKYWHNAAQGVVGYPYRHSVCCFLNKDVHLAFVICTVTEVIAIRRNTESTFFSPFLKIFRVQPGAGIFSVSFFWVQDVAKRATTAVCKSQFFHG